MVNAFIDSVNGTKRKHIWDNNEIPEFENQKSDTHISGIENKILNVTND